MATARVETRCLWCGQRKGKRACPALGGPICTECCGENRQTKIACPEDCVYLPATSHLPPMSYGSGDMMRVTKIGTGARDRDLAQEAALAFCNGAAQPARFEEYCFVFYTTCSHRDAAGERIVDRTLRELTPEVPEDERKWLQAVARARFGVLRVTSIDHEAQTFSAHDERHRETVRLKLPAGPRMMLGLAFAGWIADYGDGEEIAAATLIPSPIQARAALRAYLRDPSPLPVFKAIRDEAMLAFLGDMLERSPDPASPPVPPAERPIERPPSSTASHSIPPPAHEVMKARVPGLGRAVERAARSVRATPGWNDQATIAPEQLAALGDIKQFLLLYAQTFVAFGHLKETGAHHAEFLSHHVHYLINFELYLRKLFWVDESLAYMLRRTDLDIAGELLKLPFPACAFVYNDRETLELAERMIADDTGCDIRGERIEVLSAYVVELPAQGGARGLSISLLLDSRQGGWPYLVARELYVRPDDDLDRILDSHFPETRVDELDPLFARSELRELIHIVINSIMFATSANLEISWLPAKSSNKARGRASKRFAPALIEGSSEGVFWLPGKIEISQLRRLQSIDRAPEGRGLMKRFMVRGHWRRANPSWRDQSLRWIEPHWKGPDLAMVIEREYKLKP